MDTQRPNRREFLYYIGGASLALLFAEMCAGVTWLLMPRKIYGVETGLFLLDSAELPQIGDAPRTFLEARCVLVRLFNGLLALDTRCVRDIYTWVKWVPTNDRFECPNCGSKFHRDGSYIEGAARRNLDRFVLEVTTSHGTFSTSPEGDPVNIDQATQIVLDTTHKILGQPRQITGG